MISNLSQRPRTNKTPLAFDKDDLYACLGKVIIKRRKEIGLTQDELARRSGVDRAFISELERGKRQPSFGTVSKLASGLNIRYSRLVRECETYLQALQEDSLDGQTNTASAS
jgi:transcriptional regulator with XRE-family HTH domain